MKSIDWSDLDTSLGRNNIVQLRGNKRIINDACVLCIDARQYTKDTMVGAREGEYEWVNCSWHNPCNSCDQDYMISKSAIRHYFDSSSHTHTLTTTCIIPFLSFTHIMDWSRFKQVWQKFNVANLLFCYCLPIFYLFFPAWLMPAIFLRTLSFLIGCLYQLVLDHHTGQQRRRRRRHRNNGRGRSSKWLYQQVQHSSSSTSSDSDDAMDQWVLKCSICLTRRYNLCLETCRDQFCKGCFER